MASRHNIVFDIIFLSWIIEIVLVAAQKNELRCQCSCTSMKNPEVVMYASGNLHQNGNLGLMDSLKVNTDAVTNKEKTITDQINTGRQMNSGKGTHDGSVYDTSAYAVNENNSVTLNLQMVNSNNKKQNIQTSATNKTKPTIKGKKGLTLRSLNELLKAATSQLLEVFNKQSLVSKSKKVVSNAQTLTNEVIPNIQTPTKVISEKSETIQVKPHSKTFVTDTVISGSEGLSGILQPSLNRLDQNLKKTERTVKSEEVINSTVSSAGINNVVKSVQGVHVDSYTQIGGNKMAGSVGGDSEWITSKPEIYVHPQVQNFIVPDNNNIILPSLSQTSTKNKNVDAKTSQKYVDTAFPDMSANSKKTEVDKVEIYIPPESAMSHLDKMLQTETTVDYGSTLNHQSYQIAGGSLSPQKSTTDNLGSVKTSSYIPTQADIYNPLEGNVAIFNVQESPVPSAKIKVGNLGLGPGSKDHSKAASKTLISSTMELGARQPNTDFNIKSDVYQPPVGSSLSKTVNVQPDVYIPPLGGSRTSSSLNAQSDVYTSLVGGNTANTVSTNIKPDVYIPIVRASPAKETTTPQPDLYIPVVRGNTVSTTPRSDIYIPVIGGRRERPTAQQLDVYVPLAGVNTLGTSSADKHVQTQGSGIGDHIFGTLLGTNTRQMESSNTIPNGVTNPSVDVYKPPKIIGTSYIETPNKVDVLRTDTTLGGNSQVGLSTQDLSRQGSVTGTRPDVYVPPSDSTFVQTDTSNSNTLLQNQALNTLMDTTSQNTNNKANAYQDQTIPLWMAETTQTPVVSNGGNKAPPNWITDTTPRPAADPWIQDKTPPSWIVDTTAAPTPTKNNVNIGGREPPSWFIDTGAQSTVTDTASNQKKNPPSWMTDATGSSQQNVGTSIWMDGTNKNSITQQNQLEQNTLQIESQPSSSMNKKQVVPSWLSDISASKPNLKTIQSQSTQTSVNIDQSGSAKQTTTIAEDWATLFKQGITTDPNIAQSSASISSSSSPQGNTAEQTKVTFENVDWNNLISQLKTDGQSAINSNIHHSDLSGLSKTISNIQQNPKGSGQGISKTNSNEVNMQELTNLFENYVKNVRSSRTQKKPKPKPSTPAPTQMSQDEQFALAMMFGGLIN